MRLLRNRTRGLTALLLCGLLAGCLHKPVPATLSAKVVPPDLSLKPPPVEDLPPMEDKNLPREVTEEKRPVAEEVKPKKKPKRPAPPVTVPLTAPAPPPEPPPAISAKLGTLKLGDDTNPQEQQEVAGKISAVEKRVSELPSSVTDHEPKQVAQVKLFLKEASDALKGGDVEGAKVLATKADLLVDDVQK